MCNLCGIDDAASFLSATERWFGYGGQFQYVRCLKCGLIYLHPRPAEEVLAAHYPNVRYYTHRRMDRARGRLGRWRLLIKRGLLAAHKGYPLPKEGLARLIARAVSLSPYRPARFGRLPAYVAGGRVLDVGCGNGNHLYSLRELGWETVGVEPDVGAARYARTELGLDVRVTTLEEAGLAAESVDVGLMLHVLEHVPNPLRTLQEAYRILKPDGYLIIETPNVASWAARLFRDWWFHLDAPRHLYLFTPDTLPALLHAAGFSRFELEHVAVATGITGSLQYLWNAYTDGPGGKRIRHSRFLRELLYPVTWLMAMLDAGDVIRVVAWKDSG